MHSQGTHSLIRLEEYDLRRHVTTQCDMWQHKLQNIQDVLGTTNYCHSRYLLTHRELSSIREVFREQRHPTSVTYRVFTNLSDIREVLSIGLTSEFGHLSGVRKLNENPGGFSKVPMSEYGLLSGFGKPAEHLSSFTTGTFVTGSAL